MNTRVGHAEVTRGRTRRLGSLAVLCVALACTSPPASRAGAAPAPVAAAPTASGPLGGYVPVSDVAGHAKISLDLCTILDLLERFPVDYSAITALYREGGQSRNADGTPRALDKFASGAREKEYVLGAYERQLGAGWMDAFVEAALAGTGPFASEPEPVRRAALRIGLRDQLPVAWAFHEMDAAVEKLRRGDVALATGAPHNWDEVWAYYHGERPECTAHITAEARGRDFGTGSAVNAGILAAMKRGLAALLAGDSTSAAKARAQVVRQMSIPQLQAVHRSAILLDAALARGDADQARVAQAEGWAHYRVIEPRVSLADSSSARTLRDVFELRSPPAAGSEAKVARAVAAAAKGLGIRQSELGRYLTR